MEHPTTSTTCFDSLFASLVDPRDSTKVKYPLSEILFQSVTAIICGGEGPTDIATFAEYSSDWLRKYYPYKNGFADHDTINRVLGLLPVKAFEKLFIEWVYQTFCPPTHMAQIAIDGKRIARSVRSIEQQTSASNGGKHAKVLVNALHVELRLVLAQGDASQTMSEVAGAEYLLDVLELAGSCVTADAGFLGRDLIELIRHKEADYLMTLKAKSPRFFNAVEQAFTQAEEETITESACWVEQERRHGRTDKRVYEVLSINQIVDQQLQSFYVDAQSIIRVTRWREVHHKESSTKSRAPCVHYYVSSLAPNIEQLAGLIRNHWAIENNLHWILDVAFREDDTRAWTGNLAVNLALLRKMAFNLIADSTHGKGVKRKRWAASLSESNREKLIKSIMR